MKPQTKLLVVDDEHVVCESCSRIFSERGFEVETCTDSMRGLDLATEQSYRAILVDLMMPNVDGLEFLRRLRQHDPSVPVIFITGYASVPTAAEAMRLGATDYIPKPFTPEEILKAVQRVFDETEVTAQRQLDQQSTPSPASEHFESITETTQPVLLSGNNQILFYGDSWTESVEGNRNVPVGALIPPSVAAEMVSIHLPKVGAQVYQGLPMAWMLLKNGNTKIIPAPLSGRILDVNNSYKVHSTEAVETIAESWMTIVEPNGSVQEQKKLTQRLAIVLSNEQNRWQSISQYLHQIGCKMLVYSDYKQAKEELMKGFAKLFVLDGQDWETEGPERVREINWHFPGVRVVVANDTYAQERAYRTKKIAYYSGEMLSPMEWMEMCSSIYKKEWFPRNYKPETPPHAKRIKTIQVKSHPNQTTTLLFRHMNLDSDNGLGAAIRHQLLAEGYPVEIQLGMNEAGLEEIQTLIQSNSQIILLEPQDRGAAPGWVEKEEDGNLAKHANTNITKLVLQPYDTLKEQDGIHNAVAALIQNLIES